MRVIANVRLPSVRHTVFFLIEPKQDAIRTFPLLIPDLCDVLLKPILTSRNYADRSPWRPDDVELVVKLLYLARSREYTTLTADQDAERILGSSRVSVSVFDRWWSIRRVEMEESSEELEGYPPPVAKRIEPTGNKLVDEFLQQRSLRSR